MNDKPTATMDEFTGKFLLRAFQAVGVADDSVSEPDLKDFASSLREQMGLLIGDAEIIQQVVQEGNQVDFIGNQHWHETCDALEKKLGIVRPQIW